MRLLDVVELMCLLAHCMCSCAGGWPKEGEAEAALSAVGRAGWPRLAGWLSESPRLGELTEAAHSRPDAHEHEHEQEARRSLQ